MARDGFGDMAVSNAIGSNVFDINLGIGLPYFIRILISKFEPANLLTEEEMVSCDRQMLSPFAHCVNIVYKDSIP